MDNSKLIDLLRTFSPREWRSFQEMVAAPYFNRNKEVVLLCEWLAGHAPHFTNITRDAALRHLYPDTPANTAQFHHLMSFLLKLAEQFLGLEAYYQADFMQGYFTLRALGDRNLEKHYHYNFEKAQRVRGAAVKRDVQFFYEGYLLENYEAERPTHTASRVFNESVQRATDHLDSFYLLEKLRLSCYMLTSQAILATPYNLQMVEEVRRFVGANLPALASPAIEAYYRIFQLLTQDDPHEDFSALKILLAERADAFGREDLAYAYQYAINFCNLQIMKVREQYVDAAFDLYLAGVDSGILLQQGTLSPWHFKNIIKLSLRLQKYAWTEQFITENTRLLAPEFQADARHYNLAELYYHTHRFDQSMSHLTQVEFTDVHYSLGAKVMLCKIFQENDDFDALESMLHAFNTYLRRNKLISEEVRKAYLNFILFLRKIRRAIPAQYASIIEDVQLMPVLIEKKWLLKIMGVA